MAAGLLVERLWNAVAWGVLATKPGRQPVEAGEEHALGDVCLIEFVANLPFDLGRDDDFANQAGMLSQPIVERHARAGHQREQRKLIDDPGVERRWLEERREVVPLTIGQLSQARRTFEATWHRSSASRP